MISNAEIFNINSPTEFEKLALKVFKFQFENNKVYRSFCDLLYKHPADIKVINEIPFLPIEFFKTREVISTNNSVEKVFSSSGTT